MGVRLREKPKGSGRWWVVVWHQGRRTSKQVGDKKQAQALARDLRDALARRDYQLPAGNVPTLAEWGEGWLVRTRALGTLSVTSQENYAGFLRVHVFPALGALRLTDLTPQRLRDFAVAKRSPGGSVRFRGRALSAASVRVGLNALRLLLDEAVEAGHLQTSPLPKKRLLPRRREMSPEPDPFTVEELRAILTAAERISPDFAVMLRLWAQSGMRAGELAALQWHDVDLTKGTAVVRRNFTRGRLQPHTKTRASREVSILHPVCEPGAAWQPGATPEARSALAGLRRLRVQTISPEGFIFGGAAPLHADAVNRQWRRVLRAAGVRYRPGEVLRHSFASQMLSRGAPLLYVQRQGGWRSAAVLLSTYARWLPQDPVAAPLARPTAPQARPAEGGSAEMLPSTGTYGAGLNFQK